MADTFSVYLTLKYCRYVRHPCITLSVQIDILHHGEDQHLNVLGQVVGLIEIDVRDLFQSDAYRVVVEDQEALLRADRKALLILKEGELIEIRRGIIRTEAPAVAAFVAQAVDVQDLASAVGHFNHGVGAVGTYADAVLADRVTALSP